jgi:hypothetical protein
MLAESFGEIHCDHMSDKSEQDVFLRCILIHKEH